jgi:hypothetical protein
MSTGNKTDLKNFNNFCSNRRAGTVLYNIDSTNLWGELLLVVNISTVKVNRMNTYTVLMLGLKREEGKYVPRNLRIKFTPDYASNIPFLKYVGYCKYHLVPELEDVNVNLGLLTVYSNTDLRKFAKNSSVRKPKKRKYGNDGELIKKKANN